MNNQNFYNFPADFIQAVVDTLNNQPARESRILLNYIEQTCKQQDDKRAADTKEEELRLAVLASKEALTKE